jgi:hypothetical protein
MDSRNFGTDLHMATNLIFYGELDESKSMARSISQK